MQPGKLAWHKNWPWKCASLFSRKNAFGGVALDSIVVGIDILGGDNPMLPALERWRPKPLKICTSEWLTSVGKGTFKKLYKSQIKYHDHIMTGTACMIAIKLEYKIISTFSIIGRNSKHPMIQPGSPDPRYSYISRHTVHAFNGNIWGVHNIHIPWKGHDILLVWTNVTQVMAATITSWKSLYELYIALRMPFR